MTRYWGHDFSSTDIAGAARWCADNAREDYEERYERSYRYRGKNYCTCTSRSLSPCDYCEREDEIEEEEWCDECEMVLDECSCEEE
jgi:hypothetical protein